MNRMIIFSGFNQRAVIAFLRTLNALDTEYAIIAVSDSDDIFETAYADRVLSIRQTRQLDVSDLKRCIIEVQQKFKADHYVLAPTTEALNRVLLDRRDFFESLNCSVPLVEKLLYEQISDKYSFSLLCKSEGFLIPAEYPQPKDITFPVVAKPKEYFSLANKIQPKPKLILNVLEYKQFISSHLIEEFYFQEYVFGRCIYLLYYFHSDGTIDAISQENYVQQENGGSMLIAKMSDFHEKEIALQYSKMLNRLSFSGLIMIEFKVNAKGWYMIEANPRFWGPSQLFVDANVNLFHSFLYDNKIISERPNHNNSQMAYYFWDDGVSSTFNLRPNIALYNFDKQQLQVYCELLTEIEIYNRADTLEIYMTAKKNAQIECLRAMYTKQSKHSNYQIMASNLEPFFQTDDIDVLSRNEKARLDFILAHVKLEGKSIIDIGGNTGYFTFESIINGASQVVMFEGNQTHAEFVKLAADILDISEKVTVHPEYYLFEGMTTSVDVVFLLNVLHHVGDDYGNQELSKKNARKQIISSLKTIAKSTNILVFQLGFNWKGDRNTCLFDKGTKKELIDFIIESTVNEFDLIAIGVAEKTDDKLSYQLLNDSNIHRNEHLGEFLNRPLFILKSKSPTDRKHN